MFRLQTDRLLQASFHSIRRNAIAFVMIPWMDGAMGFCQMAEVGRHMSRVTVMALLAGILFSFGGVYFVLLEILRIERRSQRKRPQLSCR